VDDLVRIHGVGPYLAARLNEQGVYTFRQVAAWTDEDVEVISKRLGAFEGRIRRDDWIGSARREHEEKYGERLP
jgi:predicted flap endonuclease-1-like 5' DNA nuclease